MTLNFDLLTPNSTVHAVEPGKIYANLHSFSKYTVHKLVTDEQTDGQAKGQVENIMPPASLQGVSEQSSHHKTFGIFSLWLSLFA